MFTKDIDKEARASLAYIRRNREILGKMKADDFGYTLKQLMKWSRVGVRVLSERSLISTKTIQRMRNHENYQASVETVIALCVGMQLPPPVSHRFLALAGYQIRYSSELLATYDMILDKTKIDKSTITDTGTESMKQGLTELRYADNTRKAVQNTARGTIKTAAAIRNMPADTKAQVQRIRRNMQKARAAAKKSADVIRKVLTSKAGLIVIGAALAIILIIMLANGLITVLVSAVISLFSWMFPDGDSSDTVVQNNISSYISQIHAIQSEKQAEIDEIVNGLSPEYRYDGTVITGLNRYSNSRIEPYDDNAILAVLAVQKFHSIADASTTDFHFTDDEIREAVEQFYNFSYRYEYDYCPDRNGKFDLDCLLSLASGSFYISQSNYDIASDTYAVTLNGTTYSQASRFFTRLEIYMADGGKITGSAYAGVSGGTWQITYNIGGGGYRAIDWNNFYLIVDTTYCNNPNHCYLYGEVENLSEEAVLNKAGFTEDEREIFEIYKAQILAMGG